MTPSELESSRISILEMFQRESFIGVHTSVANGPGGISRTISSMLGTRHGSGFKIFGHHVFVHRIGDTSRMTLFAQTPLWDLGTIASSREMLEKHGYLRDGLLRLNCTLKFRSPNSQGLYLETAETPESVVSRYSGSNQPLCYWPISRILNTLETKHRHAVMVNVESLGRSGPERFHIVSLTFYSSPKSELFLNLLREGAISIDHLISQNDRGSVVEKGPVFKLERSKFLRLFSNVKTVLLD